MCRAHEPDDHTLDPRCSKFCGAGTVQNFTKTFADRVQIRFRGLIRHTRFSSSFCRLKTGAFKLAGRSSDVVDDRCDCLQKTRVVPDLPLAHPVAQGRRLRRAPGKVCKLDTSSIPFGRNLCYDSIAFVALVKPLDLFKGAASTKQLVALFCFLLRAAREAPDSPDNKEGTNQ